MRSKTLAQQIVEIELDQCDDKEGEALLIELLGRLQDGQAIDEAVVDIERRTADPVLVSLLYLVANRVREAP